MESFENQKNYSIHTLGCKANFFDSQVIESTLQKEGWKCAPTSKSNPRLLVVNTCCVTQDAEKESRKLVQKLIKQNPSAKVVVTGCAAEVNPRSFEALNGASLSSPASPANPASSVEVIGNRRREEFLNQISSKDKDSLSSSDWGLEERFLDLPASQSLERRRTRVFLKIQEGCDSRCTYCIIPYGRGPSRSLRIEFLVEQVCHLVDQGIKEVVLTGTNLGDYGKEWWKKGEGLEILIQNLLEKTSLPRLRLSSLDPTEITPRILAFCLQGEGRLCSHFHVSLQSTHDRILRLMKRFYRFQQIEDCLLKINEVFQKRGGGFVGMDVITGFPSETEAEFEWIYQSLEKLPWSRLHVFPYSDREGTPATRLKDKVLPIEKQRRARLLMDLSLDRLGHHYRQVLKQKRFYTDFLLEGRVKGPDGTRDWLAGYTQNYIRGLLRWTPALAQKRNELLTVELGTLYRDASSGDISVMAVPVVLSKV